MSITSIGARFTRKIYGHLLRGHNAAEHMRVLSRLQDDPQLAVGMIDEVVNTLAAPRSSLYVRILSAKVLSRIEPKVEFQQDRENIYAAAGTMELIASRAARISGGSGGMNRYTLPARVFRKLRLSYRQ